MSSSEDEIFDVDIDDSESDNYAPVVKKKVSYYRQSFSLSVTHCSLFQVTKAATKGPGKPAPARKAPAKSKSVKKTVLTVQDDDEGDNKDSNKSLDDFDDANSAGPSKQETVAPVRGKNKTASETYTKVRIRIIDSLIIH
jgi:hypothetical protein